ncbi:nucleoside deaminase [Calorimonas adulescens]|nr:nucleoside deaminase [Calorimonas adulescens]
MIHDFFMHEALNEARKALNNGEVPVGAVVVMGDKVVGRGYNMREMLYDATAHAEILAIRDANANLKRWRLEGCTMYVTLEPCPMCAGAIILSRMDMVVIGAQDPRMGFCGSVYNIIEDRRLGKTPEVITGILEDECQRILKDFFNRKR